MKFEKILFNKIRILCNKKNAEILEFIYYKKIFGNIVVKIKYKDSNHEFIIDRSEVYYNYNNTSKLICSNIYGENSNYNRYEKLLETIDKELN